MADFNLDDLGNVEVDFRGVVQTVSKYDSENLKGGFFWLTKPNNGENANILGSQIIKITMPFEMFDYCQNLEKQGQFTFPGVFYIRASVVSGAGNKGGYRAISIEQIARLTVTAQTVSNLTSSAKPSEKSKPISSMPDLKA